MIRYLLLSILIIPVYLSCSTESNKIDNNKSQKKNNADSTALIIPETTPSKDSWTMKITSQLLYQIDLKQKQLESPTQERLKQMESMGIETRDLTRQKIFMHVYKQLTNSQQAELQSMNIIVYPDSWLPPVGVFPTGYYLAEIPINLIADTASREYIAKLDTAEQLLEPQIRPR